ncbi:Alpha-galactosidase [Enterococcus sp. HSIEG1]|nr:Alpha-galactosidase [Enterococcus sp. HSIEG1]
MIEIITDTIFHLYNEKISYVMHVLPNRQLGHLYFGPSLGHLSANDMDYLTKKKINLPARSNFLKMMACLR